MAAWRVAVDLPKVLNLLVKAVDAERVGHDQAEPVKQIQGMYMFS